MEIDGLERAILELIEEDSHRTTTELLTERLIERDFEVTTDQVGKAMEGLYRGGDCERLVDKGMARIDLGEQWFLSEKGHAALDEMRRRDR